MSEEEISWRGFPLDEIYDGFGVYENRNQAPDLEESSNHTILFKFAEDKDSEEQTSYKWDDNHVKLPNNPESVYFEIDDDGNKVQKYRWDLIKDSLSQKITNSHELEEAIKKYNTKYAEVWKFKSLHSLFEDEFLEEETEYFFEHVLPKIIEIALKLPELIKRSIPYLQQKMNHSISMTKEQAACLLANAFLCTFPNRNGPRKSTDFPEINFNRLFCNVCSSVVQKIKCICNYFRRVLVVSTDKNKGVLTFQRRHIELEDFPKWEESELKFNSVKWHIDSFGRIETSEGMLQMDFANRYLGGGILGFGSVQEEIRFSINPECIVGMLFCESMKSTEAILMYGTEQYSKYSGYSGSFKWEGNYVCETPCDKYGRKLVHIVAIDALPFRNPYMQFEEKLIRRDVNKAYCGFYHDPSNEHSGIPVAGGFWGCGAFGGFNKLKCLIQLIACVANRRNLVFYTFGNEELVDEMHNMFSFLSMNEISVGQLWSYLAVFKSQNLKFDNFYQFIYDQHVASLSLEEMYQTEFLVEHMSSESVEKRRVSNDGNTLEVMQVTQECTVNYVEIENPSKRTKTEYYSDDKSDLGSEVEIGDKCEEPSDEESLDEIIVVTNEQYQEPREPSDEALLQGENETELMTKSEEVENNDQNAEREPAEENIENKPVQQRTILDYFKPKPDNL